MREIIKNKKTLVITVLVLLVLAVGLTFAYFVGQIGSGAQANVTLTTATVDTLTFSTGADITIGPVTQQNFASGAGNKSGSTTASAMLRANNTTNTATETYNLYLNITNNTFHKTTSNAELILTITNPNGTTVNSISGLTYTTVGGVSGFDVTEKSGLITIANNYTITVPNQANNPKTDTWNITLTFVNLDADQTANAGASFSAQAIIQKEAYSVPEYYWNADFDGTYVYSYPIGQKVVKNNYLDYLDGITSTLNWTSGSPTTYPTRELLASNYAQFSSRPYYIKTTIEHQACLYYNNHEFCLGANYWDGILGVEDTSAGLATKTKLQTAMESALGTSATSCHSYSGYADCYFGSFGCDAYSNGAVDCAGDGTYCVVGSDGVTGCIGDGEEVVS